MDDRGTDMEPGSCILDLDNDLDLGMMNQQFLQQGRSSSHPIKILEREKREVRPVPRSVLLFHESPVQMLSFARMGKGACGCIMYCLPAACNFPAPQYGEIDPHHHPPQKQFNQKANFGSHPACRFV